MIIIIGSENEFHSRFIYEKLKSKNIETEYFDSRKYPVFSWAPDCENNYILLNEKKIYEKDIHSLYWRWYYDVSVERSEYGNQSEIVYREKVSALESILTDLSDKSYNSLQAIELHRKKPIQTELMKKNNIRIPATLITNNKNALEEFYIENNKNIIYKPVRGGAFTQKVTEDDLKRADSLINCPCQLQECIDGVDIRVYAFDSGEVFAGKIVAQNIDFREDENAKITQVVLPEKIQQDCLKVMKILGLKYSGIDIRLSNSGEYVFIEANPAPMFVHFENVTGYPISDTLIKNLTR